VTVSPQGAGEHVPDDVGRDAPEHQAGVGELLQLRVVLPDVLEDAAVEHPLLLFFLDAPEEQPARDGVAQGADSLRS
jgi:hypothetical protein